MTPAVTLPPTRERLLDAALELIAERGFANTTVGDIESAAGLSPRRGGLYKHFESKEAVLRAALERFVESTAATGEQVMVPPPGDDLRAALTVLAEASLQHFHRNRLFMRIAFQERPQFPDLIAEMHRRAVAPVYPFTAAWLDQQVAAGVIRPCDTEALAATLLIAFVGYRVELNLFDTPPGGIDTDRFIATWVDLAMTYMTRGEDDGEA